MDVMRDGNYPSPTLLYPLYVKGNKVALALIIINWFPENPNHRVFNCETLAQEEAHNH